MNGIAVTVAGSAITISAGEGGAIFDSNSLAGVIPAAGSVAIGGYLFGYQPPGTQFLLPQKPHKPVYVRKQPYSKPLSACRYIAPGKLAAYPCALPVNPTQCFQRGLPDGCTPPPQPKPPAPQPAQPACRYIRPGVLAAYPCARPRVVTACFARGLPEGHPACTAPPPAPRPAPRAVPPIRSTTPCACAGSR
jgi:hypothetical protein